MKALWGGVLVGRGQVYGQGGAHADWLRSTAFEGERTTPRSWPGNSGVGVARRDRRKTTVDSTGRCNGLMESFSGCIEV